MNYPTPLHVAATLAGLCLVAAPFFDPKDPPCVCLASDLVGMKVVSPEGESLGSIEDIVVHPGGSPSYAVLSFGGWLGMGDKLFAMPWSVFKPMERAGTDGAERTKRERPKTLVLPVSKERLRAAPGFDKKNWPMTANPEWARDIDKYYAGESNPNTRRVETTTRPATSHLVWQATELKGANVDTPTGDKLGDVRDLGIDMDGRVCFATPSVGGFLGIGDKIVAVPWDQLKFSTRGEKGDKKIITLAATKAQLEGAPEFKEGKEHAGSMCEPQRIGQVYEYFSTKPYWTTSAA